VAGYQIQPGEFAKVLLVIFLAGYLREKREVLERPVRTVLGVGIPAMRNIAPLLVLLGAALVMLVALNDLGSSLLFYGVFIAMIYLATGRWLYVGAGSACSRPAPSAPSSSPATSSGASTAGSTRGPTRTTPATRSPSRCTPSPTAACSAPGFGRGFVLSGDDTIIPYAETDFIFSVIATETGSRARSGVVLLYLAIAHRGFKIAAVADDGFSKLLAAGLTFVFSLQAFVIIGGVTKLIPLTGLTLPFVSYGGSSVVANFALLALLLCVSQRANRSRA
jgi:cell division protein FtsW (lipid II flippase)